MTDQTKSNEVSSKKTWNKPQLRAVVPASHTRGGAFAGGPQEDASYSIS
jgi:hypothetical protein